MLNMRKDRNEYMREYQREWMRKRRSRYVINCVDCNTTENLEVHHRNPEKKVTHRIWSWKIERLEEELSKCDVLCEECHNKRHGLITNPGCGTTTSYKRGCRCELCRTAKSEYDKKYYAGSSKGRTQDFGSCHLGSNPSPASSRILS